MCVCVFVIWVCNCGGTAVAERCIELTSSPLLLPFLPLLPLRPLRPLLPLLLPQVRTSFGAGPHALDLAYVRKKREKEPTFVCAAGCVCCAVRGARWCGVHSVQCAVCCVLCVCVQCGVWGSAPRAVCHCVRCCGTLIQRYSLLLPKVRQTRGCRGRCGTFRGAAGGEKDS